MYMYIYRVPWLACRLVPGEDEVEVYCSIMQFVAMRTFICVCFPDVCGASVNSAKCVAVCCSVLQRVAACCSVLQRGVACCSVQQCVTVRCSVYCLLCTPAGALRRARRQGEADVEKHTFRSTRSEAVHVFRSTACFRSPRRKNLSAMPATPHTLVTHCNTLQHTATHKAPGKKKVLQRFLILQTRSSSLTHCHTCLTHSLPQPLTQSLPHTLTESLHIHKVCAKCACLCDTVQHTAAQCCTVQHTAAQCCTVQQSTAECRRVQQSAAECSTLTKKANNTLSLAKEFYTSESLLKKKHDSFTCLFTKEPCESCAKKAIIKANNALYASKRGLHSSKKN